jgi:hypothetical protein
MWHHCKIINVKSRNLGSMEVRRWQRTEKGTGTPRNLEIKAASVRAAIREVRSALCGCGPVFSYQPKPGPVILTELVLRFPAFVGTPGWDRNGMWTELTRILKTFFHISDYSKVLTAKDIFKAPPKERKERESLESVMLIFLFFTVHSIRLSHNSLSAYVKPECINRERMSGITSE